MICDKNQVPVSRRTVKHFLPDEKVRALVDGEWRAGRVVGVLQGDTGEYEVDLKVEVVKTVRLRSEDIYHVDGNKEREP